MHVDLIQIRSAKSILNKTFPGLTIDIVVKPFEPSCFQTKPPPSGYL